MSRFAPYVGITLAFFVGLFIAVFSSKPITVSVVIPSTTNFSSSATTTKPTPSFIASTSEERVPATTTTSIASILVPEISKEKVVVSTPRVATISATSTSQPTPVSSGNGSLDMSATALRKALVNIICYVPVGSGLHSISGSGVFIDAKGIILTNAHIAQYFLLADRTVSCSIRTGSPAVDSYQAGLIYIPSAWIHANPDVLTKVLPRGTGEYDFALLAITKSKTKSPLPSSFPSVPLAQFPPTSFIPVAIATYGAQFLEINQIQSSLFPTIVFGSVKDVFTFDKNTIDVLALGGSPAAQEGSSGGGVADATGSLVGTITTSTIEGSTDTRSLEAITASYIRAEYERETGSSLDTLLSTPTENSLADFAPQIPALESIITAHLQ